MSTFFWTNETLDEGDYIGIDLGDTKSFGTIRIDMANFTGQFVREDDYLHEGRIEVSTDGDSWSTVATVSGQPVVYLSPLDIGTVKARYVRLVATQGQGSTLQVREFTVDSSASLAATVDTNFNRVEHEYRIIDGQSDTALSAPSVPADGTITVRLSEPTNEIQSVRLLQDPDAYLSSGVLEYMTEGTTWQTLAEIDGPLVSASTDSETVQAIRIRATDTQQSGVAIHELIGSTDG